MAPLGPLGPLGPHKWVYGGPLGPLGTPLFQDLARRDGKVEFRIQNPVRKDGKVEFVIIFWTFSVRRDGKVEFVIQNPVRRDGKVEFVIRFWTFWAPGLGWGTTFQTIGCCQDLGFFQVLLIVQEAITRFVLKKITFFRF